MIINKKYLLIVLTSISTFIGSNFFNNNKVNTSFNYQLNEKKSLTTMFLNNKLEKEVDVGTLGIADNIEIQKAVEKEITLELNSKTNQEITQKLDYTIEINSIDNKPLPFRVNLENPVNLKVKIAAGTYSKILKDEVTVTCIISYPFFNLDDFLKNGAKLIYEYKHTGELVNSIDNYKNQKITNWDINPIGEPKLNENISTFNYFGESIFENNTDVAQTYLNPTWKKSIANQSSVSFTNGVNVDSNLNIANVFGISVKVDFQKQTSSGKSETQTISSPQTPTIVEPHKKMQVLVYLNAFVSTQEVTISCDLEGPITGTYILNYGKKIPFSININDIINFYREIGECPKIVTINSYNNKVHIENLTTYTNYNVGTLWKVITNPIN